MKTLDKLVGLGAIGAAAFAALPALAHGRMVAQQGERLGPVAHGSGV